MLEFQQSMLDIDLVLGIKFELSHKAKAMQSQQNIVEFEFRNEGTKGLLLGHNGS
jgi:hypothetical protein